MDKIKNDFPFPGAPPIAILGVPFDNLTTVQTVDLIERMVASRRPHYLATANVDFIVQAAHDVELRRILFDAHLVLCDGTPLVWASRLLGNPLPERVAGSDLVPLLLKVAAERGYRPFLLGATPDSIEEAVRKITLQHPKLELAGYYSPPFNKLLEMDHEEICRRIAEAKPDLLFVGFGCPKQEKWIYMHYRSLGVPVSVGIGGTIDFLAGKLARAPRWMQVSGTEWIYRLAQEPKRLLSRYAKDLWYFSGAILAQSWRLRAGKARSGPAARPAPSPENIEYSLIDMPDRLDFEVVHRDRESFEAAIASSKPCIIQMQNVRFVDSTGIGLLIRLQKRARLLGQQLILVAPSENTRRALQLMKLEEFFIIVRDLEQAQHFLRQGSARAGVFLKSTPESPFPVLAWSGELTAANAEEVWAATADHLAARSLVQRTLTIDLAELRFMDSTGLGLMIRAKKTAARSGLAIAFAGAPPAVSNVIRLSRLEDYLLGSRHP